MPHPADDDLRPGRASTPGMPRWVRVFLIVGLVLIVVVVIGLLTGQLGPGGGHGPGRHLGSRGEADPSGVPGGIGGPAEEAAAARRLEVTALETLTFDPATMRVSAGETVTFEVTNNGSTMHEFTLGDAAMQQQHARAMAHIPAGTASHFPNSITLRPGETKRLTWRFGDAASVEYACHVSGHYEAGMRGRITVI